MSLTNGLVTYDGRDLLWHSFDANGQVFGHESSLDGFDADSFQSLSKHPELCVVVQLRPVEKTSRPGKDGG